MADASKIEWCDSTFNPWIGCTKVGPGCDHCYAEADFDLRKHRVKWGAGQERSRTSPANWKKPLAWNEAHAEFFAAHGRRRRVFCASLADVFDNEVPDQWRHELFDLILNTPNLDWLLLTKRIGNVMKLVDVSVFDACPNIWLGATIVNQEEADRDIHKLLATPARVRFLSMEPLLGPVDLCHLQPGDPPTEIDALAGTHGVLRPHRGVCERIDWVIAGGERGPQARPMHPDWALTLRNQCAAFGVPFLFKQWGEWLPCETDCGGDGDAYGVADDGSDRELSGSNIRIATLVGHQQMARVGKKAAGRLLDGIKHDAFPGDPT